jgi:pimeloyl-ACP methyl ester carboxylesterase
VNTSGAVLIGHSMGAIVILEAARQTPERIAGLVLVDGTFDVSRRLVKKKGHSSSLLCARIFEVA